MRETRSSQAPAAGHLSCVSLVLPTDGGQSEGVISCSERPYVWLDALGAVGAKPHPRVRVCSLAHCVVDRLRTAASGVLLCTEPSLFHV
jgi:hypothetical protein